MITKLKTLVRLIRDRNSPEFKQAPVWLVVMINEEIAAIKKDLNPLNYKIKFVRK